MIRPGLVLLALCISGVASARELAARVIGVEGAVAADVAGAGRKFVRVGDVFAPEDRLVTGDDGVVILLLRNDRVMRLDEENELRIGEIQALRLGSAAQDPETQLAALVNPKERAELGLGAERVAGWHARMAAASAAPVESASFAPDAAKPTRVAPPSSSTKSTGPASSSLAPAAPPPPPPALSGLVEQVVRGLTAVETLEADSVAASSSALPTIDTYAPTSANVDGESSMSSGGAPGGAPRAAGGVSTHTEIHNDFGPSRKKMERAWSKMAREGKCLAYLLESPNQPRTVTVWVDRHHRMVRFRDDQGLALPDCAVKRFKGKRLLIPLDRSADFTAVDVTVWPR